MEVYSIYKIVFILYFCLAFFYFFQRDYYKILLLLVFSIPFKSIYLDIGGAYLEIWKGISLLLLPITFSYIFSKKQPRYIFWMFLFFIYSAILTLCIGFLVPENIEIVYGGILKKYLRPISQVFLILTSLNLFFVFKLAKIEPNKIFNFIKIYIIATTISSFLGCIQWVVYNALGYNLFPIPRLSGELEEARLSWLEAISGQEFFRLNSLSMEPKNLASYIAFMLIIIIEYWITFKRPVFNKIIDFFIVTLSIFVLYYTYSSLGYIILILGLVYTVIVYTIRIRFSTIKEIFVLALILLVLSGTYFYLKTYKQDIFEIISLRTIERVLTPDLGLVFEDFDEATVNYIKESPEHFILGLGFGNIHKFASYYLPDYAMFAFGTAWMPKSGLLYMLAGCGFVGVVMFLGFFIRILSMSNLTNNLRVEKIYLKDLVVFSLFMFIVRYNEILFFLTGLYILSISSSNKKLRTCNE